MNSSEILIKEEVIKSFVNKCNELGLEPHIVAYASHNEKPNHSLVDKRLKLNRNKAISSDGISEFTIDTLTLNVSSKAIKNGAIHFEYGVIDGDKILHIGGMVKGSPVNIALKISTIARISADGGGYITFPIMLGDVEETTSKTTRPTLSIVK